MDKFLGNKKHKGGIEGMVITVAIVLISITIAIAYFNMGSFFNDSLNKGASDAEAVVQAIDDTKIKQYEGQEVTGIKVKSIIQSLGNTSTILVATLKDQKKNRFMNYGLLIEGAQETAASDNKKHGAGYTVTLQQDKMLIRTSAADKLDPTGTGGLSYLKGVPQYVAELMTDANTGDPKFNEVTIPLTKKGSDHLINDAAKFKAFLLVDTNGKFFGLALEQKER